jgi:hypothetical protein
MRPLQQRTADPGSARGLRAWARTIHRALSPFWMFEDVNRGDLIARAAAAAHNRQMIGCLPRYLRRWLLIFGLASLAICGSEAMATDVARQLDIFVLMAAGSGLVCACAACVALVIGYAWCCLRLARHGNR